MRSVKVYEEAWPLHTPFVISRGSRSEASVVVVEIEEEGLKAWGMYALPALWRKSASVMAQIMTLVPDLQKGLTREALQQRLPAGARATPSTVRSGALKPLSSKNR
jgi:L-alanine-DL-glutamate epimerase-like enolase superfamily enzyme